MGLGTDEDVRPAKRLPLNRCSDLFGKKGPISIRPHSSHEAIESDRVNYSHKSGRKNAYRGTSIGRQSSIGL